MRGNDEPHTTVQRQAQVAAYIAYIVVGVWAVIALASIYTHDYQPLTIVTPVALIVVGFLFGYRNGVLAGRRPND